MNKKIPVIIIIVTFLVTFCGVFLIAKSQEPAKTGLDDFAKCLTSKGAVMYGSASCSHCQKVKSEFGASFQYVNYFECPINPNYCIEKGINGYPTWIFSDGNKIEGESSLSEISQASGCPLPATSQ